MSLPIIFLSFFLVVIIQSIPRSDAFGLCCKNLEGKSYFPSVEEVVSVDNLRRIPCNSTSLEYFRDTFEQPMQPVVLVGCDEQWAAKSEWTFENLAERIDSKSEWRIVELGNDFPSEERSPWGYVLDALGSKQKFYVFDNLNTTHGKELENDYVTPPFFRHDLYRQFESFPPDYGPMRWFAVGSRYTGTTAHYDPFETDAWNTVVQGMKWWILFPPNANNMIEEEDDDDDYELLGCDPECSDENVSLFDYYLTLWRSPEQISDIFAGQTVTHVIQKAGETLYVPNGMIHRYVTVQLLLSTYVCPNSALCLKLLKSIMPSFIGLFLYNKKCHECGRYHCNNRQLCKSKQ